ncbi:MAG: tRNA (adenosine(37)-N6)-dimethylallyltransferase MiaA [Alphaproteobacteria bacterium]
MRPRAILIAGPTASGKSALALALAEAIKGTVINADALQVYAELEVLTARPDVEARARAPHALYGHVPSREAYSVARWLGDARFAVAAAERAGRLPIIVGGTGLYFRALLKGLADIPEIPAEVREEARALIEGEGAEKFRARLARVDPDAAARLPLQDRARAVRAFEVAVATGRSITEWQQGAHRPLFAEEDALRLALMPANERLRARIAERFEAMLAAGALDEVARIAALELPARSPTLKVLGFAELAQHLSGTLSLADAKESAIRRTRQYAKRQRT